MGIECVEALTTNIPALLPMLGRFRKGVGYPEYEREELEQYIQRVIRRDQFSAVLACVDREPAGYTVLSRNLTGFYLGEEIEPVEWWVEKQYRGKGVDRMMIDYVVTLARDSGAEAVSFVVMEEEGILHSYYERAGFMYRPGTAVTVRRGHRLQTAIA